MSPPGNARPAPTPIKKDEFVELESFGFSLSCEYPVNATNAIAKNNIFFLVNN